MSAQQQFLRQNQHGIEEYRISAESGIKSPSFMPEIKAGEDLHALLPHLDALDDNNPVIVPGYRWEQIRSQPSFSKYGRSMRRFMNLPLIYYEPPEFFRYTLPDKLVTYALQGSRTKRERFNEHVRNGDLDAAIEELPLFFQPFVDRQRESLLRCYEEGPDPSTEDNGKVAEGWGDPRADQGYESYYREIVENAKRASNSHVVPPVPAIRKSSGDVEVRRMRGSNRAMADICDATSFAFGNPVYPYYHVYADTNILRRDSPNVERIFNALQKDLGAQDYGGVALTLTGYENAWESNIEDAVADFVERLANLAERHSMPLHLPRSSWYGAFLTDVGVNAFGSLLNGKERYTSGGGMSKDNFHYQYGSVAIYDHAVEFHVDQLEKHLQQNGGQVHPINGLPDKPPVYNPRGQSFKDKFGNPRDFRINFGKPRRLLHAQEAREFRGGLRQGLIKPASRYFERSQHNFLSP